MELASMLAGERFGDRPRSVCPVIAAFLRAYNDRVDDRRRADLYACAAAAVGTRDDALVECRAVRLAAWALEQRAGCSALRRWRTRRLLPKLKRAALVGNDTLGWAAARIAVAGGSQTHAKVPALLAELAAVGHPTSPTGSELLPTDRAVAPAVATAA